MKEDWATKVQNKEHTKIRQDIKDSWMLRQCQCYSDEKSMCQSLGGRLHQYYVNGSFADCSQWVNNYKDCKLWSNNQDKAAAERVIASEKSRIRDRLVAHFSNDVWERRETPPDDWNKPLSDHLEEAAEDSHLRQVRLNLEEGAATGGTEATARKMVDQLRGCAIM